MATAIFVKTESGDEYLYCVNENLDEKQVKKFLKKELAGEFEYICSTKITYSKQ